MRDNGNKINAVILDFNGTMVFDSHIHRAVWHDFIPEHGGGELDMNDIDRRILGRDNTHILHDFFGDISDEETERLAYEKEAEYRRRCMLKPEEFHFVKGVAEFLDYLNEKSIPHTIATGSDRYNVDFYFEYFGLGKWFDRSKVVLDDGSFPGKPDPEIYLRAAELIGASPSECLVLEDSHAGVASARRAGIGRVIAVVSDDKDKEYYASAGGVDRVVRDFSDWKTFLD